MVEEEKQIKVFLNPNPSSDSPRPRRDRSGDHRNNSNFSHPLEEHRITLKKENNEVIIVNKEKIVSNQNSTKKREE